MRTVVSYFTKRWALGERGRNSTNVTSMFFNSHSPSASDIYIII